MFQLNASVIIRAKVDMSSRFSELKSISQNSIFCLCRSQLRSYHFMGSNSNQFQ